tara:strand:- start:2203 stop:2382 length:180 start_codon:yes stop_codon:yes gene_type:complete
MELKSGNQFVQDAVTLRKLQRDAESEDMSRSAKAFKKKVKFEKYFDEFLAHIIRMDQRK